VQTKKLHGEIFYSARQINLNNLHVCGWATYGCNTTFLDISFQTWNFSEKLQNLHCEVNVNSGRPEEQHHIVLIERNTVLNGPWWEWLKKPFIWRRRHHQIKRIHNQNEEHGYQMKIREFKKKKKE
jgi:hypothetical protein